MRVHRQLGGERQRGRGELLRVDGYESPAALWSLPSTFVLNGSYYFEFLKEQRPDLFDSAACTDQDRSSSGHSELLATTSNPRLERNSSYFKSLLILAHKEKLGSSHKSERGAGLEKGGCLDQKEPESRYVKYNKDRTICWRQSKQPFFGIERIPVTPVSPLQKFHRWDDLIEGQEIAAPANVKLTIKPFTRQTLDPSKQRSRNHGTGATSNHGTGATSNHGTGATSNHGTGVTSKVSSDTPD